MELPCEAGRHSCGEARWLIVAREKGVFCRPTWHNVNIVVVVSKGYYDYYFFFGGGRNFYLPIFLLTIFFTYFFFM